MNDENIKFKNNPIYFSNEKVQALDEAFQLFMDTLNDYLEKNDLANEEINEIKSLIKNTYLEKKLVYLLENRFSYLNETIENAFKLVLDNSKEKELTGRIDTNLYYLKKSKRFTLNE